MDYADIRRDIVEIGRRLWTRGFVASNDGNISVKVGPDRLLMTPASVSKYDMTPEMMVVTDLSGTVVAAAPGRRPSSEMLMHLVAYEKRPDIGAVVHAHPPVATGFATAGLSLNKALLPEVVIGLGCVPLADYGLPGTPALTEPMLPLIPKYDAILLANHGAVSYGKDVLQAYFRMETVEHFARINFVAEMLGGAKVLPKLEVDKLFTSRTRYGVASRATPAPGCPTVAEDYSAAGANGDGQERFWVTRDELVGLVEQAMRERAG